MIRINFLSWFLQKLGNIIESQINDSDLRQALYDGLDSWRFPFHWLGHILVDTFPSKDVL